MAGTGSHDGPVKGPEDAALEGLKSALVLMVDDDPTSFDVLEMFLEAEGYRELVKLSDSRKALAMIAGLEPDVVLLNLGMPHVSGLEILAAMQRDPALRAIPVLIITGSNDPERKRRALELGAADFLAKPVDPSELALRLRNTLASRAYRDGEPVRTVESASAMAPARDPQGSEDRIRTIVDTFLGRLRPRLDAMAASLASSDFAGVAELAHWLKGAAGTVGLHEFTEPAAELGRLAREGNAEPMGALVGQLRRMAARAERRDEGRGAPS